MEPLTPVQTTVFRFLKSYAKKHGYPPTRAEIASNFEWSSDNAAQQHLMELARKGYIRRAAKGIARGLVLLK